MRSFPLTRSAAALFALTAALAVLASCGGDEGPVYPSGPSGPGSTFASPILPPTASYAHTFPDTGTFGYHCGLHPMIMKDAAVHVTATATSATVPVSIVSLSTPGFSPDTARVLPGGTVTWTNDHTMNHSVVSD